jgi:hypothetical protein
VTIDGGATGITDNPTATIAGASDATPGTPVTVDVDAQSLTAVVQSTGTWSVTPSALTNGTFTVAASVTDPAGNVGTASQALTVDTVAPAVTITGGATALTDNAAPVITGTANVGVGTPMTVTLADQTLTTLVQAGGTWSVTAAFLQNGSHRIIMSVYDAAGTLGTTTQTLTVDTVAPTVTIAGGATRTTTYADPTITGTSNAAPGTTVTVSIGTKQTVTTLLQANGTWNATPTALGKGKWAIVASVPDPAGNVGTAKQIITITGNATLPTGSGAGSTGGSSGGSGGGQTGSSGSTGAGTSLKVWLSAARYKTIGGKRLQVPFTLSAPAKVTLTVLRGKTVVAKLTTTRRHSGRGSLTWNGKIKRKFAPAGTYTIVVQAISPGASAHTSATMRIT